MLQNYIDKILSSWHALQFAVQQQTGGSESYAISKWMNGEIEQFFLNNDDLYPDEVAEFLSTILNQELNTLIDDESDMEISKVLCQVYELHKKGNVDSIQNILSNLPTNNQMEEYKVQSESDTEEEMQTSEVSSQISSMNISDSLPNSNDTPLKDPTLEEEDGWVMIKKGKKKTR